ncbi:hypothetical protein [Hoeflea sp.]|uniref:hypothetical protein n=1 Tax=Hoeflea sp. TaxID=1940281 RepID=UPI003B51A66F
MSDMDKFPEDEKRWYMHVGYLAQNWAAVETTLDGIIRELHMKYDGHLVEPSPPHALNRKTKYVRKVFAAHPKLQPHSSGINSLLELTTRLAAVRHWTLHGGWVASDANSAMLKRFSRSEPMRLEGREFSIDEIFKAAKDCGSLTVSLSFFAQHAFGLITAKEINEFFRKLAGES